MMTDIDTSTIAPLTHEEAMRLQCAELDRTLEMLRDLDDAALECTNRLSRLGRPRDVPPRPRRVRGRRIFELDGLPRRAITR